MKPVNIKKPAVVVLSAMLLVACGGGNRGGGGADAGNGAGTNPPQASAPDDIGTSVPALISYMERLIATDENSETVDINAVTLAVDDTTESS